VLFTLIMLVLLFQAQLQPGLMIIFSFILFVLYVTGLAETAVQLFGEGAVNSNCNQYVNNAQQTGATVNTLAWLQQNNICKSSLKQPFHRGDSDQFQALVGMPSFRFGW
jgi:hypothetical protein